ncbi:MAG TPA: thioredoxin domain-containing protein [Edaphocola sp.]|nr:thioredoxin domain-containing protein [Edaphocola sp.]
MKKITIALLMFLLPLMVKAQGLQFEEGTFAEVLTKAKKENKLVFVDVYTTWCGPCKMMAAQLFPAKEAGDLYNKNFINYKIDAEKGEGIEIAAKYKVEGYPTNLFLDADGKVLYRVMGAGDLKWFLNNAQIAIAESKDPMSIEEYGKQFANGNNKKDFLEKYFEKASRLGIPVDNAMDVYVNKYMKKKVSDKQLLFLLDNNQTTDNKAYEILKNNQKRVDELKKEDAPDYFNQMSQLWFQNTIKKYADLKDESKFKTLALKFMEDINDKSFMSKWFLNDQFFKYMNDEERSKKYKLAKANEFSQIPLSEIALEDANSLEKVRNQIKAQIAKQGLKDEALDKQTNQYIESQAKLKKMASLFIVDNLNEMAWEVYEQNNKALIPQAIQWAAKAVALSNNTTPDLEAAILDTYAHLLYANGDKEKAILNQGKAVELLKSIGSAEMQEGVDNLEEALGKMKSGTL